MIDRRLTHEISKAVESVCGNTMDNYKTTMNEVVDSLMEERQEELYYECFEDALNQKREDLVAMNKNFEDLLLDYCLDELVSHFHKVKKERDKRLSLCETTGSFH